MSRQSHFFLIGRKQQQAEEKSRVPIGTREALDFFGAAAIFAFEERMSEAARLSDQVLAITFNLNSSVS